MYCSLDNSLDIDILNNLCPGCFLSSDSHFINNWFLVTNLNTFSNIIKSNLIFFLVGGQDPETLRAVLDMSSFVRLTIIVSASLHFILKFIFKLLIRIHLINVATDKCSHSQVDKNKLKSVKVAKWRKDKWRMMMLSSC